MIDTSNLIKGIDVSVIQSVIPWEAVYAEGYRFVICRCFVGNGGKDTMYDKNIVGANAAGLKTAAARSGCSATILATESVAFV